MSTIKIRIAGKGDARYIALLGRITFTGTFGHLFRDGEDLRGYCEETFNVGKIETSLQKSSSVYWIAFSDRLPVGYAKLKLNSPSAFIAEGKICQLQKIYVLKDFLSLRVGFQLQEQMLQKAREYGYSKIWLSVLEENERATLFYKKMGLQSSASTIFRSEKSGLSFWRCQKHYHNPRHLPRLRCSGQIGSEFKGASPANCPLHWFYRLYRYRPDLP